MKNVLLFLTAVVFLAGCGSSKNEGAAQAPSANQSQTMAAEQASANPAIATGVDYLHQGDIKGAIKSFDEAIRQNPKDVQAYLVLGQTYMHLKDYNRAIDTFTVATRVAPDNGQAHFLLATNLGLAGNYSLAKLEAQKSLEIFRQNKDELNFKRSVALLQGLPVDKQ